MQLPDLARSYGLGSELGLSGQQLAGLTLHAVCLQLSEDTLAYPSPVDAQRLTDLQALLTYGIDANFLDDAARTPLWWVVMANNYSAARILLQAGASCDYQDGYGCHFSEHVKYHYENGMVSSELYNLLQ